MSRYVEHLRATLSPDEFEKVCEIALARVLAADPDAIAKDLPVIAEEMRAEGFTEMEVQAGVGGFADEEGLNRRRGYN